MKMARISAHVQSSLQLQLQLSVMSRESNQGTEDRMRMGMAINLSIYAATVLQRDE